MFTKLIIIFRYFLYLITLLSIVSWPAFLISKKDDTFIGFAITLVLAVGGVINTVLLLYNIFLMYKGITNFEFYKGI